MKNLNFKFNDFLKEYYPFLGILIILFWTAFNYGGRYLQIQVVAQVLTALLLIFLSISIIKNKYQFPEYPIIIQISIFLFIIYLSFINSVNKLASLEEILRYLMYFAIPFIILCWASTPKRLKLLIYSIVLIGFLVSMYSLIPFIYQSLIKVNTNNLIFESTFARTNDLGSYLLLIVPISLVLIFIETQLKHKIYASIIFAILFISLIFTNSRGVWLSGFISIIILLAFTFKSIKISKTQIYALLGSLGLISILLLLNFNYFYTRFTSIWTTFTSENSFLWRLSLLKGAIKIFLDNLLLGTGINTFSSVFCFYQEQAGYFSINPHNYYLQLLSETGILGLLSFLFLILSILYIGFKNIKKSSFNIYIKGISIGLFAALIALLLHIAFDIEWSVSAVPILFWTEVGIILAINKYVLFYNEEYKISTKKLFDPAYVIVTIAIILFLLPLMNIYSAHFYTLSNLELNKNNLIQANKYIYYAINLAPYPSAKHYGLFSTINLRKNDLLEAKKAILKAIILDRYNDNYYTILATILAKTNETYKAASLFETAIQIAPYKYPNLYTNAAYYYTEILNKPDKGIDILKKGINAFPVFKLPLYEYYNPGHRYELFNLYYYLSEVYSKIKDTNGSNWAKSTALKLLNEQPRLPNVPKDLSSPTDTVTYYWNSLELIKKGVTLSPTPSPVIEKLMIPKLNFKFINIEFTNLKKGLDRAEVKYKLKLKDNDTLKVYEITDLLLLTPQGWQIIDRL